MCGVLCVVVCLCVQRCVYSNVFVVLVVSMYKECKECMRGVNYHSGCVQCVCLSVSV